MVFSFPLAYQAVHMLNHSLENHLHCNHKHISADANPSIKYYDDSDRCYVCDYKFSINRISDIISLKRVNFYFIAQNSSLHKIFLYTASIRRKSPRAPPIFIHK